MNVILNNLKKYLIKNNWSENQNLNSVFMVKRILTFVLIVAGFSTYAQQPKTKVQETSNAEKFSERSGSLIQKEIIDIGDIKKCELKVIFYKDLISNQKTSALKFEYEFKSSYSSDTKAAILDTDEIDGLIKSIKIIQEKIFPTTAVNYTEVSFRSRGEFEAGCFSKKDSWAAYMKLEKFDSNSYVFMEKEDLIKLLDLLGKAKLQLQ